MLVSGVGTKVTLFSQCLRLTLRMVTMRCLQVSDVVTLRHHGAVMMSATLMCLIFWIILRMGFWPNK